LLLRLCSRHGWLQIEEAATGSAAVARWSLSRTMVCVTSLRNLTKHPGNREVAGEEGVQMETGIRCATRSDAGTPTTAFDLCELKSNIQTASSKVHCNMLRTMDGVVTP